MTTGTQAQIAADSMAEKDQRRKSARVAFSRGIPARIVAIDGTWSRDCVMLDAGDAGAKLEFDVSIAELNLKEFFLQLSTSGVFRRCELAWVNGEQIGVHFLKDKPAGRPKRR
jgi:PilZ domain